MTDQKNVTPINTNDTASSEAVIDEALGVIYGALAKMMQRDLVSTGEVADLLLDVRTLLTDVQPAAPLDIADIKPVTPELA